MALSSEKAPKSRQKTFFFQFQLCHSNFRTFLYFLVGMNNHRVRRHNKYYLSFFSEKESWCFFLMELKAQLSV